MNLIELISKGLKDGGYDGLYRDDSCACKLDDLAPCGCLAEGCNPGVFVTLECCDQCTPKDPCEFHMGQKVTPNPERLNTRLKPSQKRRFSR